MGHVPPRGGRHAASTRWPGSANANGGRAELTFDHPNMAANYFFVSLFVVVLSRSPRHRLGRFAACVVVAAMVVAGSNAALLGLPLAAGIAGYVAIRRHSDSGGGARVVMIVVLLVASAPQVVQQRVVNDVYQSDNKFVQYSVARSSRSASAREQLFAQEYELFRTGSLSSDAGRPARG